MYVVGVEARKLHLRVNFLHLGGRTQTQVISLGTIPTAPAGSYVNLTQTTATQEEGTSAEKMSPPPDWPVDKPMGHFLNW